VLYQRHLSLEHARTKIEEFNKELDAEMKEKEPKIEEGKEATEEQVRALNILRSEYSMKKIKKFD